MKGVLIALVAGVVTACALSLWVRTRSVPADRITYPDRTWAPGDHAGEGGIVAVRQVEDADAAFRRLADIVLASPRTELRDGGPGAGRMIVVTRTAIMGFPDVTQIWTDGDLVLVRAHLVIGRSDMGVNARRVRGWLDRAGLTRNGS